MFKSLFGLGGRIIEWLTGSLIPEAAAVATVGVIGHTIRGELHTHMERGIKLLQLAFFPDLTLDDESGFERVKDMLEEEMRVGRFTEDEASQMMADFDTFLEVDLKPWQAKIFRYTVMSHEDMDGRLSVLRRMFTLNPDDPGSLTIPRERRLQIMRNIASEEPIMMKLGDWLRENSPKAWRVAKEMGLNTPQFAKFVFLGVMNSLEVAVEFYVITINPKANELADEIAIRSIRASRARRSKHGLL